MPLDFDKYAMKGNEFLNRLAINLGNNDRAHAARILRNTFSVLRNHFTLEESFQLLSQLPMALKGVYVDGWKLSEHRKIKTIDELFIEIIEEDGSSAWRDFDNKDQILDAIRAVINTLRSYVSSEEMDQALGTLPERIQTILQPFPDN